MKPILFNEQMMRAILDGKKTQTRRLMRCYKNHDVYKAACHCGKWFPGFSADRPPKFLIDWYVENNLRAPYAVGDILYCRETWKQATIDPAGGGYGLQDIYLYKADEPIDTTGMMVEGRWHPSIHMPRMAARVFLRVTCIYAEHLQSIRDRDIIAEGIDSVLQGHAPLISYRHDYGVLWNSTIQDKDLARLGWSANPWVWAIHFEKISKEEALQCSLQNAECAVGKSLS